MNLLNFRPRITGVFLICVGLLTHLQMLHAQEVKIEQWWQRWALAADVGLQKLSGEIEESEKELSDLAQIPKEQTGERLGYHSRIINDKTELWVQIDLQGVYSLDSLVLVPVVLPQEQGGIAGYGFPQRFQIQLLTEEGAHDGNIVLDATEEDFPNPGREPVVVDCEGAQARFIRLKVITAGQIGVTLSSPLLALAEIMALQGDRNVAAGRPVTAPTSREAAPVWSLQNLTDSQSILGPPVGPQQVEARGWHSVVFLKQDEVEQIEITWPQAHDMEDVRLFPLRWKGYPHWVGFGFPLRFRIEAYENMSDVQPYVVADYTQTDFPNPGLNPVVFPTDGLKAQRIKLIAIRQWERFSDYACALAEIQVFSSGRNIAPEGVVHTTTVYPSKPWKQQYLADGFTVDHPILPLDQWMLQLQRTSAINRHLTSLKTALNARFAAWNRGLWAAAAFITFAAFCFIGALALRATMRRRRELRLLRDRIARDLHDEVGSNLAGIALLGREGEKHSLSNEASDMFREIREVAEQTSGSMRDLVWMIRPGMPGDLPDGLRGVAARLLPGVQVEFQLDQQPLPSSLPPDFKRQVYLIFREALQNITRHSMATHVWVTLRAQGRKLHMMVRDNGVGLATRTKQDCGMGLANMRERAKKMKGHCEVCNAPDGGCQVTLLAPFP